MQVMKMHAALRFLKALILLNCLWLLITVKGVGPKAGLNMSVNSLDDIKDSIVNKDATASLMVWKRRSWSVQFFEFIKWIQ